MVTTNTPAPLQNVLSVGFTGHRKIENPEAVASALGRALDKLVHKYNNTNVIAFTSIAAGADLLFVEQLVARQMFWFALLPKKTAEFQADFSPTDWLRAQELLAVAKTVEVVSTATEPLCYREVGKRTVEYADVMIALWDGLESNGPGGTAEIVSYAQQLGKEVICLREVDGEVIPVTLGPVADKLTFPALLQSIGPKPSPLTVPPELENHLLAADQRAQGNSPKFRRWLILTVLLNMVAITLSSAHSNIAKIINLDDQRLFLLPVGEFLFLTSAIAVSILILKGTHQRWLGDRLAAEICRSAKVTWALPFRTDSVPFEHYPQVRSLIQRLLFLRAHTPQPNITIEAYKRAYAHWRIADQYDYFSRQLQQAIDRIKWQKFLYCVCIAVSLIAISIRIYHKDVPFTSNWLNLIVEISPQVFPALASCILIMVAASDSKRRVARYQEMQEAMTKFLRDLDYEQTWDTLRAVVEKCERLLLSEVLEWHSTNRFTVNHDPL